MTKLIVAVLLLAVCYPVVRGDARCFMQKLTDCSKQLGKSISLQVPDFMLCKYRKQLFGCIEDGAKECSVNYDFSKTEAMYDEVCTTGTPLNKKMEQYRQCLYDTFVGSTPCIQDIIDFVKRHKDLTPEVMFELEKLTCQERTKITSCYFDAIEKNCGKDARNFYETISDASEKVNEEICHDLLNE